MVCARKLPMHLIPRESYRSVVSLQVCAELTRPGAHFISPQLMARNINAFICYYDNNNNNNNNNTKENILLTTMLTIKILITINSLEKKKKAIYSKHYLQFLSI